jgi:hypothetical protein
MVPLPPLLLPPLLLPLLPLLQLAVATEAQEANHT